MGTESSPLPGSRQERRKAVTRAKILTAAEKLFDERGYADTSIEDISGLADVAVRTIYIHFSTKAAIMLASFDAWVDLFVEGVLQRPVDEPVVDTVRASLAWVIEAGREDRVENSNVRVHPLVEHLHTGSPDVAGHVMQRWMIEMDRIAGDAATRGNFPRGSLEPQARATAIFAAWIAAISGAAGREHGRALPDEATGHSIGLGALELITGGTL